jgi:hypothetical protein
MTTPSPSCESTGWSTILTSNPSFDSRWTASFWVSPVTSATETSCGAFATASVIVEPLSMLWLAPGLCLSTVPGSSLSVTWSRRATLKPRSPRVWLASSTCWPVTSGTSTCSTPVESSRITVEPFSRVVPDGGLVRIARPDGTLSDASRRSSISNPARCRRPRAELRVRPPTVGTFAVAGPLDTVTVTLDPLSAFSPPAGSVLMTVPTARSSEFSRSVCTVKPSRSSAVRAAAWSVPTTSGTATWSGPWLLPRRKNAPAAIAATTSRPSSHAHQRRAGSSS